MGRTVSHAKSWSCEGLGTSSPIQSCAYIADFRYKLVDEDGFEKEIVEDAKGVETAEFKLKKKMMKAILGIDVILSKKRH